MNQKKVAIMQPYFVPYIGYFQLMNAVDEFVIYDNIQYTKRGWINRNRILVNGKDQYFSLPLKKDSDFKNVNERFLLDDFELEKVKLLRKLKGAYQKAPFFDETYLLLEKIFFFDSKNLFEFIFNSINQFADILGIKSKITVSSTIEINHNLKSEDKVIAICKKLNAKIYINPAGGVKLYSSNRFKKEGLKLLFADSIISEYKQFENIFVPRLSIIDVLMFNDISDVKKMIENVKII